MAVIVQACLITIEDLLLHATTLRHDESTDVVTFD